MQVDREIKSPSGSMKTGCQLYQDEREERMVIIALLGRRQSKAELDRASRQAVVRQPCCLRQLDGSNGHVLLRIPRASASQEAAVLHHSTKTVLTALQWRFAITGVAMNRPK